MKETLDEVKRKYQPDFTTPSSQLSAARVKANQQYNTAVDHIEEKLREHRDALAGDASALGQLKRFVPRNHLLDAFRKVSERMTEIELPAAMKAFRNSYLKSRTFLATSLKQVTPERRRQLGLADFELPEAFTDDNLVDISNVGTVKYYLQSLDRLLPARAANAKRDISRLMQQLDTIEQLHLGTVR